MALFAIVWQLIVGPDKGPCEVCQRPGWRQQSIVDPGSPGLRIYCKNHHRQAVGDKNATVTNMRCDTCYARAVFKVLRFDHLPLFQCNACNLVATLPPDTIRLQCI